jgi:hypothetical protein
MKPIIGLIELLLIFSGTFLFVIGGPLLFFWLMRWALA